MTNIVQVHTAADIVAAAAPLIGYAPANSFVAYMLRDDPEAGHVVRCAICFPVTITTEQAARFPTICNLRAADNSSAILLLICDPDHDRHARIVLDALRDALQSAGIPVSRRLLTRDVTTAGQWLDADSDEHGPTYPYTDALLTAQRVRDGMRVSPSRSEIQREFDPIAPARPVEVTNPAELAARTTDEIAGILAGHRIASPTLATRAGILITTHQALRDAMLEMALDHAPAAADLWTHLSRQLRGQARAEALTVAAVCYCLAGDTVRASIAIDAGVAEADQSHTPPPRLAGLLLAAIQTGTSPTEIRNAIANTSHTPPEAQ